MAYIYEVNGQRVEFEREPTEKDIDEAARSLRPAPQSQQQKPVEGAGGAAFGVYRPQGRRPESQQDREAAKDMPLQTARGVVTGTLGAIPDVLNLPGNLYGAATGQQSPYQVPFGSEQWNEMLPFKSDAPSAKLARLGGEVMAPFPTVKGLQTIPKAAGAVGDVVSGAVGTGTGYIARPGRTPRGYQVPSQRNPIGPTFTPPEEFAKFERGELPYGQMPEQRPISELPEGRLDKAAMMLSGGNIPNAGQGARAFGERLGETYRNPITAAADIGSMFFTGGVPVLTALRGGLAGAQALADMRLANKGFTPELPKILNEYQTGVRPMPGVQPGPMPRGFQAAGPISPGGMAAPTPAAQAAMATTQAKAPSMPKPAPQPKQTWSLPDVATHYAQAEQGSANFGDTFNKAVAARTADLLKDAQQRGQKLTREMADAMAYDEIKAWRSENVEAFKPKPQPPELVGPVKPTELPPEPAPVKREPVYNTPGEMRKALVGKVTPDEMDRLVREKFPAVEPTTPAVDAADGFQVRAAMKMDAGAGVTTKNKQLVINKELFNETAKIHGMPEIDWTKVMGIEDLKQMPVGEARKAIRTEINRQFKEADAYGKITRGPTQKTRIEQERAAMTPEELKAVDDAAMERVKRMSEFMKTGKVAPSKPKVDTPPVSGPVAPEGVAETPKLTTNEILELIKSKRKNAPPGTMSMMAGEPNDFMSNVMMGKLKGSYDDLPTGSHTENGIRHEILDNADYTRMPDAVKELVPDMPKKIYRQVDVKTGKVLQGPKSYSDLQAEAADLLKKAADGKKKQGK